MSDIIYQGETAIIVGETALDLTDYENVKVIVYDKNNNIAVKAAMVAATGYDATIFQIPTGKTDEFEVFIADTVTAELKPGKYYAEVKTKYDDTDWGEYVYDTTQKHIFEIRHAKLK